MIARRWRNDVTRLAPIRYPLTTAVILNFRFLIWERVRSQAIEIKTQKSKIPWRGAGVAELAALEML